MSFTSYHVDEDDTYENNKMLVLSFIRTLLAKKLGRFRYRHLKKMYGNRDIISIVGGRLRLRKSVR